MKCIGKICSYFLFLWLPYCCIYARPVNVYEAELAVKGWLKQSQQPLGVSLGDQIEKVEIFASNSPNNDFYVVYLKPSGFVIVSGDDLIEPIIGFADDGKFIPDSDNPLGALVNNDLKNRIYGIQNNYHLSTILKFDKSSQVNTQNKWQAFINSVQSPQSGFQLMALSCLCDIRVAPLIQSRWNQGNALGKTCYNYYTPNNYPCGCLATAMAQLMRYFEYPTTGIGMRQFSITVDKERETAYTVGGNDIGGPYKWNEMLLKPGSYAGIFSQEQRKAIGSICYDAGISVSMEYTQNASGASMYYARYALDDTFSYNNIIYAYNYNESISTEELYNMINPSLDAGTPVILGIFTTEDALSGHAVICDGYAFETTKSDSRDGSTNEISTPYHHLNMGWGGTDDVWYNLPDIDSTNYEFKLITSCLYNIFPDEEGEIISGQVLDPNNNPIPNAIVYTKTGRNSPISTITNYRGIYAFKGVLSNTPYNIWANIDGYITPSQTVYTQISQDNTTACGNVWGVDFYSQTEPNLAHQYIYYVDNDAPGDPLPNSTSISDSNENGSQEHPFDSIQEAIDIASNGDKVIIFKGTYAGEGNRDIDFGGKVITVTGEDPNDPNLVKINCQGTVSNHHRGFIFQNYEIPMSVLSGITIENGYYKDGGAIYLADCARPTISNCIFAFNGASAGGAIYNNNSNPIITDCNFKENQADAGGAIYNYSSLSGSKPTIMSCYFYRNTSIYNGGAIYNNGKVSPTLSKCIFILNYSDGGGGAIRNNDVVDLTLTNCIFNKNFSNTYGGAIRNSNGSIVKITNCTFYANTSSNGKSLACSQDDITGTLPGSVQITNSILREGGGEIFNNDNSTINVTYSNLKNATTETPWPGLGNIYSNPFFADVSTEDFHLKSTAGRYCPNIKSWIIDGIMSPCIDTGNPENLVNDEPEPNNGIINMGAYGGTNQASKSYID